ncbi:hypothetical protein ACFWAY_26220 [Rhodococcus sp. NPDC059968]|uniref:hypothetical protein n=1 Tax=Rhodococcus sp. NPDC059968 TaxID=3347017 RepID=UPI00366F5BDA
MLDRTFWIRIQLETDDDLRADISNHEWTDEQHVAMVQALHTREDARLAAERLAGQVRWTEVHSHHYECTTDELDTAAVA